MYVCNHVWKLSALVEKLELAYVELYDESSLLLVNIEMTFIPFCSVQSCMDLFRHLIHKCLLSYRRYAIPGSQGSYVASNTHYTAVVAY
jgi:hypothetical protein